MKDYTLSEVIAHCKKMHEEYAEMACRECDKEFHLSVCSELSPRDWDKQCNIEPRDMIELPCKEHYVYKHDDGHVTENWRIFYRAGYAFIGTAIFPTEPEADAFLAELKGTKRG